jgi:hypothetical protein
MQLSRNTESLPIGYLQTVSVEHHRKYRGGNLKIRLHPISWTPVYPGRAERTGELAIESEV